MQKKHALSSLILALPSGIYIFFYLLYDIVRLLVKQGWDERPLIFLNIENIISYMIFALCSLLISYEIFKKMPNYITKFSFFTLAVSLLFYWIFFLLNLAAVSST